MILIGQQHIQLCHLQEQVNIVLHNINKLIQLNPIYDISSSVIMRISMENQFVFKTHITDAKIDYISIEAFSLGLMV